jgi:hypothetical protein
MFVCGYTGSWYCAPRRRRWQGESPIRMPCLHMAQSIPGVLFGIHCCAAFALRGWSLFLSSLLDKGSAWLAPTLNALAVAWAPLRILLYVNLTAAYLAWALMVLLDLIVPPCGTAPLFQQCLLSFVEFFGHRSTPVSGTLRTNVILTAVSLAWLLANVSWIQLLSQHHRCLPISSLSPRI